MTSSELCSTCKACSKMRCESHRIRLRQYNGIRLTADGFDCALPVTVDSHSVCSYGCLYCFSEQLIGHSKSRSADIGQTSLSAIEAIFSGETDSQKLRVLRKALKYDRPNVRGYPCPIQLGGINDPFDEIERQQGWALEFIKLARKYRQPVRISTKGTVIADDDYLAEIAKSPELFWVAWSINTIDDSKARVTDARAPSPSKRLEAMRKLSKLGCKTSLRMRPIWPGITDATRKHPKAYIELIERAAEAGACAISYEAGFVPTRYSSEQKERWQKLEQAAGLRLKNIYQRLGKKQACLRPSYLWTEQIMHAIYEVAKSCGLSIGVSDPVWKQLTTTGCCCGIKPDDPVFGNWQRENATNAMYEAVHNFVLPITHDLVIPPWAGDILAGELGYMGAGPNKKYDRKHKTWRDKLLDNWNNPHHERGPLKYFQGAWRVHGQDEEGNLIYRYRGLLRREPRRTPGWYIERLENDREKT